MVRNKKMQFLSRFLVNLQPQKGNNQRKILYRNLWCLLCDKTRLNTINFGNFMIIFCVMPRYIDTGSVKKFRGSWSPPGPMFAGRALGRIRPHFFEIVFKHRQRRYCTTVYNLTFQVFFTVFLRLYFAQIQYKC